MCLGVRARVIDLKKKHAPIANQRFLFNSFVFRSPVRCFKFGRSAKDNDAITSNERARGATITSDECMKLQRTDI